MGKDWTGNKKTTFTTIGASNHTDHDRAENDFYSTDPNALVVFMERLKKDNDIKLSNNIWECACGNGVLSEVLLKNNYNVFSSDIADRGYGETKVDFLSTKIRPEFEEFDILTNPPFSIAKEFVEKGIDIVNNRKICNNVS